MRFRPPGLLPALLVSALALTLPGCALHPLYAGGTGSPVVRQIAAVQISPIEGKDGWLLRNALRERFTGQEEPRYRLDIRLDDKLTGQGVLSDDTVARERRSLRARYQLVDLSNDAIILDASAGSDAGIDVVSSEYATIAAEDTALENLAKDLAERIQTRVALALREQK